MPDLSFADYLIKVEEYAKANTCQRFGQAAFNVLHELRPDLSEQVRGKEIDPFYLNAMPIQFTDWVAEQWDVPRKT